MAILGSVRMSQVELAVLVTGAPQRLLARAVEVLVVGPANGAK